MSRRQRRSFTRDFKLAALKRMAETDSIQVYPRNWGASGSCCMSGGTPMRQAATPGFGGPAGRVRRTRRRPRCCWPRPVSSRLV